MLLTSGHQFYVCELVVVELFKHKEKIVRLSKVGEGDIVRVYHILLRRLTLYKEDLIAPEHRAKAYALCRYIDASNPPRRTHLGNTRLVVDRQ